jgi:hypothetical protein
MLLYLSDVNFNKCELKVEFASKRKKCTSDTVRLFSIPRPQKEVPWMVVMLALKASLFLHTAVFPSSSFLAYVSQCKVFVINEDISTNIHVSRMTRQVETSVGKYAGLGSETVQERFRGID